MKRLNFIDNKVSVIMPGYLAEKYISESIESVLEQTYSNLELIIIIDGGDDRTESIANKYKDNDERVLVISHTQNLGISTARNTGIQKATGQYIAFCDSDDIWVKEKISLQIELMKSKNINISHSSAITIDGNGKETGVRLMPLVIDKSMIIKRNFIINSSAIIDRFIINEISFNDIKHEDYDLRLRLIKDNEISESVKTPLVKYRIHDANFTSNKIKSFLI